MKVFDKYSEYYDLLYLDKNYSLEIEYIVDIIIKKHPNAKTILDIGCGTGIHANLLATKGYHVVGVDFSNEMINIANEKINKEYKDNSSRLTFVHGDLRSYKSEEKFDVVLSLFHVFSYLNSNLDVAAGFSTIDLNLKMDGLFIFDFWYGPGVLTDLPHARIKEFENEILKITRVAKPEIYSSKNIVEVNYQLLIESKLESTFHEMAEKHSMRYYFKPELDLFLSSFNYNQSFFYNWLDFSTPDEKSWTACLVLKKSE
jgi:SAM-dependent methyltransferase